MTIEEEVSIAEKAKPGDVDVQLQYGKMLCGLADRVVIDGSGGEDGAHVVRYCDESTDGIAWLQKVAASGNGEASGLLAGIRDGSIYLPSMVEFYFNKAMRYINEERDLERAERLLLDSAEAGFAPAQRELAKLGLGLINEEYRLVYCADPMHWLKVAANTGDGETQYLLCVILCNNTTPLGCYIKR